MNKTDILANFVEASNVLIDFYSKPENIQKIEQAGLLIVNALRAGGKVISCGNGGSMADAMHFAEELTGRFRENRPALSAIAISDPSHLSCVANDYGYEFVFSKFIEALGRKGDVLLAISTSGNSANVLRAIEAAKLQGMTVIGLTGKNGGAMATECTVEIRVPHHAYADRIQEMHIKIIHNLIQFTESELVF